MKKRKQCIINENGQTIVLGMRYYEFLKVALIIGAILNFVSAIRYFTGDIYMQMNMKADEIYIIYPNLKTVDIIYGVIVVIFAFLQIYVRKELNDRTQNAPYLIVALHIILPSLGAIYNILVALAIGATTNIFSVIMPNVLISVIYGRITYKYFWRRKFMFIN